MEIPINNSILGSAWVWISNDGGSQRSTFDPSMFTEEFEATPGPLQPLRSNVARIVEPGGGGTQTIIRGTVYYDSLGTIRPLAFAKVRAKNSGRTAQTDGTGYYEMNWCPAAGVTETMQLVTDNADVRVQKDSGGPSNDVVGQTNFMSDRCGYDYGGVFITANENVQARLFRAMVTTVAGSRSLFGATFNRPKVTVRYNAADLAGTGSYNSGTDQITISRQVAANASDVASYYPAHEYGHALHSKSLGGIDPRVCPNPHRLGSYSDVICASIEGFAQFHGVAVMGQTAGYWYEYVTRNRGWNDPNDPSPSTDGSGVEGAVAAFLYDLIDPTGADETFSAGSFTDAVEVPGSYLAQVIKTCTYGHGVDASNSAFFHANGVDHWFYCMDRNLGSRKVRDKYGVEVTDWSSANWEVDAWLRDNYFQSRQALINSGVGTRADFWSPFINAADDDTDQRRLLLSDLYGQLDVVWPYHP